MVGKVWEGLETLSFERAIRQSRHPNVGKAGNALDPAERRAIGTVRDSG